MLPPGEVGLVGLEAGYRVVPDAPFRSTAAKAGRPMTAHDLGGPALLLPLLYRVDRDWSVLIEGGYGIDRYEIAHEGTVDLRTATLHAGVQRAIDFGSDRFEPFFEAGIGYYLSTFTTRDGAGPAHTLEANATGGFLGAGVRVALTADLGLTVEDRYAFAFVGLQGVGDSSVGGNTTALGLYYVWRN